METPPGSPAEQPSLPEQDGLVEPLAVTEERRRDRRWGLTIVAVAFLLSLGISMWAKRVSEPEQSLPPAPPTSVGIAGWPRSIDPVATLPKAREVTRRSVFKGFVAEGVNGDGLLDATAGVSSIVYSFESARGQGPQPPRRPGVVPRRDLCGRQKVRIDRRGLSADNDQAGLPCLPDAASELPAPRCSLAKIWALARKRGAAPSALARIEYYKASAGPAYRFELTDGSVRFSVYGDCRRVLTASESIGSVH